MKSLTTLLTRLIACTLLATSLSACVASSQTASTPLYYQPSLYGYQPANAYAMDLYMVPRR